MIASFPCQVCKYNIIKNYANAEVLFIDWNARYIWRCAQCGQEYSEVKPKRIALQSEHKAKREELNVDPD